MLHLALGTELLGSSAVEFNAEVLRSFSYRTLFYVNISVTHSSLSRTIAQDLQIKLKSFTIDNSHLVCDFEFYQNGGWFTSPNFPLNYNEDANCSYRITAEKGRVIVLKFEDFALENKANGKSVATLKIPLCYGTLRMLDLQLIDFCLY